MCVMLREYPGYQLSTSPEGIQHLPTHGTSLVNFWLSQQHLYFSLLTAQLRFTTGY
jgi:hypothetical protein